MDIPEHLTEAETYRNIRQRMIWYALPGLAGIATSFARGYSDIINANLSKPSTAEDYMMGGLVLAILGFKIAGLRGQREIRKIH